MQLTFRAIGVAVLVLATIALALTEAGKRLYLAELNRLLQNGETDKCRDVLKRPVVRLIFPRWNRLFTELNSYLLDEDADETRRCIEEMGSLRANRDQKRALSAKAFAFFVEQRDRDGAWNALQQLQSVADACEIEEATRLYEIYLEGSSAYIKSMEAALCRAEEAERGFLELLLAVQYENRGDKTRAQGYMKQAEEHTAVCH